MKRIIISFVILVLVGGVSAAAFFVPWNNIIESRLKDYLHSQGVNDVTFTVDNVALHEVTLSDLSLGAGNPLILNSVTVQYNPRELLNGTLRDLTLNGLDIHVFQENGQWTVTGLDSFMHTPESETPTPSLSDIVEKLPFSIIRIDDSFIRISGDSIQATLPFTAILNKTPETALSLTISPSTLGVGASEYDLGTITAQMTPDENKNWSGSWTIDTLDTSKSLPFPVLAGKGALKYENTVLKGNGTLENADKTYTGSFNATYDITGKGTRSLIVTNVSFPFKEGHVSSKNISIPLGKRRDITANMTVKNVSMDALLGSLTGQRVVATGTVSGTVPVILKKDGTYSLGQGTLNADTAGIIQMSAEAIPGDNEQVGLVREILKNLQYTLLTAAVDTTGGQGIVVRLSLEGHNPDVYGGHPVKLNVNLTGDVLDFIQQNAMLITKPETFLKQELE